MPDSCSTEAEKARQISTIGQRLTGLSVYNSGPDQFIHVYDVKAVGDVDDNPKAIWPIPADSAVLIPFDLLGRLSFVNGILVANSTTDLTFTAGADDCWFTATYE